MPNQQQIDIPMGDTKIAQLIRNKESETGAALSESLGVTSPRLLEDNGVTGDGTTNDTAALLAAANAAKAAGIPLSLDGTRRYVVSGLVFPAGLTLQTNGAVFVKKTNNTTYALRTGDNFRADALNLEITGGTGNDAGIYIGGSNTLVTGALSVTALTADQRGTNALFVGDLLPANRKSNIILNEIRLTGFRSPMRVANVTASRFSNARIDNFQTGVYVIDVTDTVFDKFRVIGTSPSATGGPGQNGVLLEAQGADYASSNITFSDWVVDGAPEHSYRVGGGLTIDDVSFINCISRNPGNAAGNVATGGGAFKALGVTGHWHRNLRYIGCTAQDSNTNGSGLNNFSQFSFGFVENVTLVNPIVARRFKTYSAQTALYLNAVKHLDVINPNFSDTKNYTIYIGKDLITTVPNVDNVRIVGGFASTLATGTSVIRMNTLETVTSNVFIEGITLAGGSCAIRWENPTTVDTTTGAYTNIHAKIKYVNAPTGTANPPVQGGNTVTVDYTGPIYGSYSIPSADGGTYLNNTDGKRYIRKAGAWVQQ